MALTGGSYSPGSEGGQDMVPSSELAVRGRYTSRRAIVLEAIIAIADCDDSDQAEWHRAWCRFWEAMRAAGWEPAKDGPTGHPK